MQVGTLKNLENEGKVTILPRLKKRQDGTCSRIRNLVEEKSDEIFSYNDLMLLMGKERKNLTSILQYLVKKGDIGRVYLNYHAYFGSIKTIDVVLKEKREEVKNDRF